MDRKTHQKPFLIDLVDLEQTNSVTVSQAINTALFKIFNGDIPYNNLLLIVIDAVRYMLNP